jgi:hypothetical protein
VRATSWSSSTITITAATSTITWSVRTSALPIWNSTSRSTMRGTAVSMRPGRPNTPGMTNSANSSCRNSDAPIAEIRAASRGAPRRRSGRYAITSSRIAAPPENAAATTMSSNSMPSSAMPVSGALTPTVMTTSSDA